MVLVTNPGVDTLGNEALVWVPTIAVPTAMTMAEAGAASVLNVSMVVRGFSPGGEQGSSQDIRLGTKQAGENPGRFNPAIDDITYVYDPQATTGAAVNKHYEAMVQGAKGFLIDLRGIDAATWTPTVAQRYDAYYVTLGAQRRAAIDPSAEGGKFEIVQKPFVAAGYPVFGAIVA